MKRVNQINESRALIKDSFLKLLEKKNYEDITISEIASNAQLTRMTLYRHFKSKEEIISLFFTERFEKVISEVEKITDPSFYDVMYLVLKNIKENRFIKSKNKSEELNKIYLRSLRNYNFNFNKHMPFDKIDEVTRNYIIGGINKVISDWLDNDCILSCEEVAKSIIEITTVVLKKEKKL